MRHLDGADQVVGHHGGEEHGASPVYCRQVVGRAASGLRRAGGVKEEVDAASAKNRSRDDGSIPI